MRLDAHLNLWFGALAGVIVLFYILKARRRDATVSSIMLWQQILEDAQARTPWQKLRHNLPMYLQIATVLALSLALARPVLVASGLTGSSTVIIIDGSASMRAQDVAPDRFGAAQKRANEIISAMRPQDSVSVILMCEEPTPIMPFTRDKSAIAMAIGKAQAGYGVADLRRAMSLATSLLAGRPSPQVVILSDGGFDRQGISRPPGIPVRHVLIGTQRPKNVGIVSMGTRQSGGSTSVLIRLGNFGDSLVEAELEVMSGQSTVARRQVTLEADELRSVVIDGLTASPYLSARVKSQGDVFALDDTAYVIPESARELDILLVTKGSLFLETALSLRPQASLFVTTPEKYSPSERYGLYVFDNFIPPEMPNAPVLVFDPPVRVGPVTPGPKTAAATLRPVSPEHPVLKHTRLDDVSVMSSSALATGDGGLALASAGSVTAVALYEGAPGRGIVVGFGVHQSDFALKPSFPIFILNCLEWLVQPPVAEGEHIAGRPVSVSVPAWAERVSVIEPSGSRQQISVEGGRAVALPERPGLYALVLSSKQTTQTRYFAASAHRSESRISANYVSFEDSVAKASVVAGRPLWHVLAALGLCFLTVEWWVYTRGL